MEISSMAFWVQRFFRIDFIPSISRECLVGSNQPKYLEQTPAHLSDNLS